jgi:NAD(P)H-quinone oxidoreductase subunit 2
MMVVKETQEMSESVKNYPDVRWNLPGMRPLQVGLVATVIATSLAGILSNPLFTLANDSVAQTSMLQPSLRAIQRPVPVAQTQAGIVSR